MTHKAWRLALAGLLLMSVPAAPSLAVTGGISVSDALNGQAGEEYEALADQVQAVTVAILLLDEAGRSLGACTGTLVHPRVVLTAGHCLYHRRQLAPRFRVLFMDGARVAAQRQVIDTMVHPEYAQVVGSRTRISGERRDGSMNPLEEELISADIALLLLHRPAPDSHAVVRVVERGFRDDRGQRKVVAGFGKTSNDVNLTGLDLRFAIMKGNTRDYRGRRGGEILLESHFQDGRKVNICSGDSGGPVLVQARGSRELRQIGVSTAADMKCREYAAFAPLDTQRATLRRMFDELMQGEQGAVQNPF